MNLNSAMRVSAAGLTAERFRMDVISVNIANANSTRSGVGAAGEPYRRREVVLRGGPEGPQISQIAIDGGQLPRKFDPSHPFKDAKGFVDTTNVEPVMEMVSMMSASRAYEANIAAFNTAKSMIRSALTIGKV